MNNSLSPLLKKYFGYETFRPLQREIMETSLTGRDVVAILPTGAGKSLCFQLPALARDGLTLVISPLIALMKDQVDSLTASGIPATLLNSSVPAAEAQRRKTGLRKGEYQLLYAAPERVMSGDFIEDLKTWNLTSIAIDEAHCISEWGHDFRPEYRQIAQLRDHFPGVPFLALTATATEQVRGDIVRQLRLANPEIFLASFNRPNLNYTILPKNKPVRQVYEFIRTRPNEAGIVYVQSRKTAESMAAALAEEGIKAIAYHAGLQAEDRAANQDAFLRDEARVVCATIAFGMGINKPDVRYVIHADLPKNIEGYYQETGRAGRDGLPSECVLLFSRGDLLRNLKFLEGTSDPQVLEISARQMRQMADFAEGTGCRRSALMGYFGETWPEENCGACDNCLQPREIWDATLNVQKLLSCVFRIEKSGGFRTGLNHVVEVLTGAKTEKVRQWKHDQLSTYGIGNDWPREEWTALGRQLIRLNYLSTSSDFYETLSLAPAGFRVLKERQPVLIPRLPQSVAVSTGLRAGDIPCDELLFDELRTLRKQLADEREVPPYVVFGDISLRHMARAYPIDEAGFVKIPGVGGQKLKDFGESFIREIQKWLTSNERRTFPEIPVATVAPKMKSEGPLGPSHWETLRLFRAGKSAEQIAKLRDLSPGTIVQHLAAAVAAGELAADPRSFYTLEEENRMRDAFAEHGFERLGPVHAAMGGEIGYEKLHYYRALNLRQTVESPNE
jgi:ATP-dependent DNA helicase RecQ